jgi:drug/metabolite transporter (DMT)-like permease
MAAAAQMLCGGIMLVVLGLALGERLPAAPTLHGTAALVYLALLGSIAGFGAYLWLLQHVRPALAGSYAYVNPPIAVLLGAWLADERFGAHDLGAMAVILIGVVVIARARARKA